MKVIERSEFKVIGLLITCQEHELYIKMPKLYKQLYELCSGINNQVNDYIYDICVERKGSSYTQFVGVEVENLHHIPEEMTGLVVEKAHYLYYLHKGKAEEIFDAFVLMYDYCLKEQIKLDNKEFKIEMHDDVQQEWHLYLKLQ